MRASVLPWVCKGSSLLLSITALALAAGGQSNPAPFLNQPLVPATATPGGPTLTLTVNGTGFVSGSVAQWNGAALATQFVSASQLTATVPASDIAVAGTACVTVLSPEPSGNVSNPELFSVASARPTIGLGAAAGTPAGNYPYQTSLAVADFNGDGEPDAAVPDELGDSVSILLGNGDGTFQPQKTYPTGADPYFVVAADVNRDGKVDLVVTNTGDNTVSVLLGNADGTFQPHVDYAVGPMGDTQNSIVVADFNRDGNPDLAVCCNLNGTVSVLLGNGDGTFQSQLPTQVSGVGSLAVGDFNSDGILDLADGQAIWLGDGDGTFTQGSYILGVVSPIDVVTADFNGDGKLDLALINGGSTLYVALGNGDGTFQSPVTYTTAESPTSIAIADFNGDGKLDVAVGTDGYVFGQSGPYGVISTLLGNGDGAFQVAVNIPGSPNNLIGAVAATDFNGDGMMDLGTLDGGLATAFLGTTAAFSPYIVNFGGQALGTTSPPQTVTLANTGSSAIAISSVNISGEFAQTNNCGTSLAAGASCAFNITFRPTTVNATSGSLTVTDSALGSPQTVALSGTGEAPGATLSPATLSFGNQLLGTTSHTETVTLTNTGNLPLTVASVKWSGAFTKVGGCFATLPPAARCGIELQFAPEHIGPITGTLTVTDNAAGSPQTASLSGTGIAFKLSATSLSFGNVSVGTTSAPQTVTVTNVAQSAQAVGIKLTQVNPGVFAQSNNCGSSLAAGGSCTLTVTFAPKGGGYASATLNINGGGALQSVSLTGTGTK